MVADRIKALREQNSLTQAELARRLGVTRSCVNAWEMGISAPSTQYLVELVSMFNVSADYLLGLPNTLSLSLDRLTEDDIQMVYALVTYLRQKNSRDTPE